MFKYLRYFSILSLALLLLIAFLAGIYFRSIAANHLVKNAIEAYNITFSESFIHAMWKPYQKDLEKLHRVPVDLWGGNPRFLDFYEKSLNQYASITSTQINLYTLDNSQFFTSNPNNAYILEDVALGWFADEHTLAGSLSKAKKGTINSIVAQANPLDQEGETRYMLRTFIPITSEDDPEATLYVMEVLHDITQEWSYLSSFQITTTTGIAIIFILLYSVVFFSSTRAEKIIAKQHEANIRLAREKTVAIQENQEKSKFLANISHELRTPLNAIIGFSEIIKDQVMGPVRNTQYLDYVRDIHASGVHLLSLINDILDYSKAAADKLTVKKEEMDINKIIHNCVRLMEPRAAEAQVNLEEKLPNKHLVLYADTKRLKQVMLNLLSNAVKFTPEQGTVTVSLEQSIEEDGIVIEVNDTGIGIAPKDISKAMATFGQVDSTLSREYEGTGLGLPLTKRLVELMGGDFKLMSEPGLGTTVTIHFPEDLVKDPEKVS